MGDCIQLCFAEELSNCTLSKITNKQCDPSCDNPYCIAFDVLLIEAKNLDLNTETMMTVQDANGTIYASDAFQCPWNGSIVTNISDEDALCLDSSTKSAFLDPNVPESTYSKCDPDWIGDKMCDDACRMDECQNDGTDCSSGCIDDFCSVLYRVWDISTTKGIK